jgi:transposase
LLKHAQAQGLIDLYFVDESGFSLVPYVPYAWQEAGETISLPSHGGRRLNVLGFMTARPGTDNDLVAYTVEGSIDGDTFIACMKAFVESRQQPTVVVLDNSPVHRSGKVEAMLPLWQQQGVGVFFLPRYAPHLNPIEILWRKMKYEWMPLGAYASWACLVEAVEAMLCQFGKEHTINFA